MCRPRPGKNNGTRGLTQRLGQLNMRRVKELQAELALNLHRLAVRGLLGGAILGPVFFDCLNTKWGNFI